MVFNPAPLEWAGLVAFLAAGFIIVQSFVSAAVAARWRHFLAETQKRNGGYMGSIGSPYLFGVLFILSYLGGALGAWFVFREGFRSELTIPNPASGSIPTDSEFFQAMLAYIIFWGLSWAGAPSFFSLGVDMQIMAWPVFVAFVTLGVGIWATVVFFQIYFVAGILIVINVFFVLWAFILIWQYSRMSGSVTSVSDTLYATFFANAHLHPNQQPQTPQAYGLNYVPAAAQAYGMNYVPAPAPLMNAAAQSPAAWRTPSAPMMTAWRQ